MKLLDPLVPIFGFTDIGGFSDSRVSSLEMYGPPLRGFGSCRRLQSYDGPAVSPQQSGHSARQGFKVSHRVPSGSRRRTGWP